MMENENKEHTLDVLQHVIRQMCDKGGCPFYKDCQDVGEGPWSSDDELYNPVQLSKCVRNGFAHTASFSGPE
jgi:hypothetical protein